jgi:hypothetical protein
MSELVHTSSDFFELAVRHGGYLARTASFAAPTIDVQTKHRRRYPFQNDRDPIGIGRLTRFPRKMV